MKNLFNKTAQVLAHTIEVKEFELWLLSDPFVNSQMLGEEDVFDIVSLNYNSRSVRAELEKIAFSTFDKEELYLKIIECACEAFLIGKNEISMVRFAETINHFRDQEENYQLMNNLVYHSYDWDLAVAGYYNKCEVVEVVVEIVQETLDTLLESDLRKRKILLKEGVEVQFFNFTEEDNTSVASYEVKKKWFEFWRK